jgi:hypothetical protein
MFRPEKSNPTPTLHKETEMKSMKALTAIAALMLAGGLAGAPAYADLPSKPGNIKVMDTNSDGKVQKEEYLAFMAKMFDKSAGTKGYCTFQEIEKGFRELETWNYHQG